MGVLTPEGLPGRTRMVTETWSKGWANYQPRAKTEKFQYKKRPPDNYTKDDLAAKQTTTI